LVVVVVFVGGVGVRVGAAAEARLASFRFCAPRALRGLNRTDDDDSNGNGRLRASPVSPPIVAAEPNVVPGDHLRRAARPFPFELVVIKQG